MRAEIIALQQELMQYRMVSSVFTTASANLVDKIHHLTDNYIRQVNGVKLADIMFSLLCVCLSVCLSVRTWLQCSTHNTFKAMDFKFDKHVHRESPDMTPRKIF